MRNLGRLTQVRHSSRKSKAILIPVSVCSIFLCPNNGMLPAFAIFNVRTDVDANDCTQGLNRQRDSLH